MMTNIGKAATIIPLVSVTFYFSKSRENILIFSDWEACKCSGNGLKELLVMGNNMFNSKIVALEPNKMLLLNLVDLWRSRF